VLVLGWKEVVCEDGRGSNGEGNRQEIRLYQPPEKRPRTKDDDEEEEEERALNTCKPWTKLSWPLRATGTTLNT